MRGLAPLRQAVVAQSAEALEGLTGAATSFTWCSCARTPDVRRASDRLRRSLGSRRRELRYLRIRFCGPMSGRCNSRACHRNDVPSPVFKTFRRTPVATRSTCVGEIPPTSLIDNERRRDAAFASETELQRELHSPHPPDVDCADLRALGIPLPVAVVGGNPHGLDPDGDGRGC